jgi:phosphatidylinositol alpha-1,6-mannosyltransferase
VSRVLVVTNDFPPRRGGIESFVAALCDRMPPDEVVVYTSSTPGAREHDARLAYPVYRDPARVLLPTSTVARRVVEVLRRHECDRVLFGASAPLGLLGRRLRRAGAKRLVALTHGHEVWWARVPVTRSLLRRIGDSVDVMTFVSEWCRDRIAPALSQDARGRMQRLSPGVDLDRFFPGCGGDDVRRRLEIAPEAPVVVCAARMVRRKGQDRLVAAWPQVRASHPDARLLLVGDGPDRRRLERLAGRSGDAASIVFTGSVPWSEVPAYLDAGDVFAMPCRTRLFGLEPEAWGIVFLEAQACGLPVLVGESGGAPETVLGAGMVEAGGADAVAAGLMELLATPRTEPAEALQDFSWWAVTRRCRAMLDGEDL